LLDLVGQVAVGQEPVDEPDEFDLVAGARLMGQAAPRKPAQRLRPRRPRLTLAADPRVERVELGAGARNSLIAESCDANLYPHARIA
jgi:hypothetical protein